MNNTIPNAGFMRLPAVLSVVPISRSTWWNWVKDGRAPKPVKLSTRVTAWRAEDIREFVEKFSK